MYVENFLFTIGFIDVVTESIYIVVTKSNQRTDSMTLYQAWVRSEQAGGHKAHVNRRAQMHSKQKTEKKHINDSSPYHSIAVSKGKTPNKIQHCFSYSSYIADLVECLRQRTSVLDSKDMMAE